MVCARQSARADASPYPSRTNRSTCVGSRSLCRITAIAALLLLATSSAFGEFLVQPIILKKQIMPGRWRVPLDFKIENLGADSPEHVSLRIVDLARDPNGIWMEARPDDPNRPAHASALPACKDWLICPPDAVTVNPRQTVPVRIMTDIPADANGVYYAGLIAEAGPQQTAVDGPYGGSLLRVQYLVPIILEAKPIPPRDVSGHVLDPEGKPVAGAQVALGTARRSGVYCTGVTIDPPMLRPITDSSGTTSEIVETDAEGRFSFPAVAGGFMLIVSHETGFARVDVGEFTPSMAIRLERWGRIEGTLYVGRRPATDGVVRLDLGLALPGYASEVHYAHETKGGPDGRFVVPKVIPGLLRIGHQVRAKRDNSTVVFSPISQHIHVKPGETLRLQIGGAGRPVVGKLVLPEDGNRPAGLTWELIHLDRAPAEQPKVGGDRRMTGPNAPSYAFDVDSDDRFRIEDVVPGRYELHALLWDPAAQGLAQAVAAYHATFEVPPMQEMYMDEPLDLGEVVLEERKITGKRIGTSSPPFHESAPTDSSEPRSDPNDKPVVEAREVAGRVLDPNGMPAVEAQVVVAKQFAGLLIRNGILENESNWPDAEEKAQFVETDDEGRFYSQGRWSDPFYLFATHASGFAPVTGKDFQKNSEIRLQRWGRIEGQLAKGRRGTDNRVWLLGLPSPAWIGNQCCLRYDTRCDADGRFVFERVPPGWFNVGYLTAIGDDSEGFTARTAVTVKAGETARVKIGGEGRPVIGRFVAPASYGRDVYFGAGSRGLRRNEGVVRDWEKVHQLFESRAEDDPYSDVRVADPRTQDFVVEQDGQQWYWTWPGLDYESYVMDDALWSDLDWRGYAFRISLDGSFRIEDVVAGRYDLYVDLEQSPRSDTVGEPFAQYRGTIEVPPMAEPRSDQPLDLGTLTLNVFGVGGPAPLFEGTALDGKPVRLIDYRGKFVLLSFSSPDNIGAPLLKCLKELHATYGSRGDFQIIERLAETDKGVVGQYIARNEIDWPVIHGDDGNWPDAVAKQYHLHGYPDAVLIDPEGRIVATRIFRGPDRGQGLMTAVQAALE